MKEYIYLLHPFRHEFFDDPTPQESAVMEAHFQHLQAAATSGTLILAGPCLDDTFGLVIFRAADGRTAHAFMMSDPAIQANVMLAELHPLRVSLTGKMS